MDTPDWALTLAFWLHMLATVVWIGGLAALAMLVLPAASQTLEAQSYAALLGRIQRRLDPLGWFCLLLLVSTGLMQMSANPNYQGFLAVENRWAAAILIKHLVFFGMIAVSAYLTWGVLPAMRREALRQAAQRSGGLAGPSNEALARKEVILIRLNLVLGILILALTALARAS